MVPYPRGIWYRHHIYYDQNNCHFKGKLKPYSLSNGFIKVKQCYFVYRRQNYKLITSPVIKSDNFIISKIIHARVTHSG